MADRPSGLRRLFVATRTARRASRGAAGWGLVFGALVANEILSYHRSFPDHRTRETFAATMAANRGLLAATGPARELDTLRGFVSWRLVSLMLVVGAVWGLLAATRVLRGEEDAGRWDLYLAGRTSRRRATAQGIAGLGVAWLLLWALTAAGTLVAGLRSSAGLSVPGCLLYATTGTAGAAMFIAVGAVSSQLAGSRRRAAALAGGVLGLAWGVRMLADGSVIPAWGRWVTPLGWVENIAPLTDPQPWALLPIAVLVLGCAAGAVALAGRRDVGEGLLTRERRTPAHSRLLTGAGGLAVRLERFTALSWAASLAVVGFVFGLVARASAGGGLGQASLGDVVDRSRAPSEAAVWIGYEFLYLSTLVAFAAAGQVAAWQSEESEGHLDHLLGRAVSRRAWLCERLGLGALIVLATGLATGLGGWLGVGGRGGVGAVEMLRTGLNTALPGLLLLGFGALLFGLVPRIAAPVLYGYVVWAFVVLIFGSSVAHVRWLTRTSALQQLGPVPATDLDWRAIGVMLAAGLVAAGVGLLAFERRDVRLG